ncbi:hypothetical protein LZ012_11520 [Dechloromonas sp. XY25]|uniref:Carboxypeptidase regulatory-like domain-containing protein n=1 Tax=Dechloromonas hankyongensis TaxID=2908002 RepID=A0ABS9K384_9RHOO|nr:hypothetical protein [Dechloromonas hankyongensis]MCG2577622.1 hypothetical protein [Dechloromonas hankyongensis]
MKLSMLAVPQTRLSRIWLMALLIAMHCWPAAAVEIDDAAKSNVVSGQQAEVPWISGGIGDEAMTEMRKVAANYNVRLMLTGPRGNYLAGVPFTISRRGQTVVSGVTEGPLLYLKLPAGSYQVAVETDGARQTRNVRVAASGSAANLRFVSRSE